MRQEKGKDLIFISRILRNGSGVMMIESQTEMSHCENTIFNLNCLSITLGTWIASEFNSYVVKIKKDVE